MDLGPYYILLETKTKGILSCSGRTMKEIYEWLDDVHSQKFPSSTLAIPQILYTMYM